MIPIRGTTRNLRKRHNRCITGMLLIVGVVPLLQSEAATQLPPTTIANIRDEILVQHDRIESLEVTYCRTRPSGNPADPFIYDTHHVFVKGQQRYRDNEHFTEHYPVNIDLNHNHQILTLNSFDLFVEHMRQYDVSHNAVASGAQWKILRDEYLDTCGWWPKNDSRKPNMGERAAVHLRHILSNPHYVLRDEVLEVDQHPCYVIESPNVDRLWLDPSVGFAIRKRELYESGELAQVHHVTEYIECQLPSSASEPSKVWFPSVINYQFYSMKLHLNDRIDRVEKTATIVADSLRLNEVSDEVFRFSPPPGTLIYFRDTNRTEQVPGGLDLLDHSVELTNRIDKLMPRVNFWETFSTELLGIMFLDFIMICVNLCLLIRSPA